MCHYNLEVCDLFFPAKILPSVSKEILNLNFWINTITVKTNRTLEDGFNVFSPMNHFGDRSKIIYLRCVWV